MAYRILLVDDEEGIRKVLGISLMDSGYDVLSAASGEEALAIFRHSNPEIVLTDIKMPVMDGLELLKIIKEESPETEVIMMTGHGDLDLAIRSLQFDAADFVTKPISDEALEVALRRARERIWMRGKLKEYTEGLENLVYEKTRQLLQSERLAAIGETVATLAHAIKNIIGGLKGGMFVLEKGMELDNALYLGQGWEMLKGNVDKIKNLALDLLNYAKEREPSYEVCDPNEPAREVYQLFSRKAAEGEIEFGLELAEGLGTALFDPEGLHCCLSNLVTNALDACQDIESDNKPGRVVISSRSVNGWAVEYRVTDNGCGMDEERKGRIFNNFFSTKGTRGTGLGLMITKKIITEHGGSIEVESEKGAGTTFVIRLPEKSRVPVRNV